ncbi:hypothetical protein JIP62_06985 [Brevundimonas vitis]|uniref:Uncharacterized protein n=1 Tax=Brevundimonas vitisensis TaxID=2800818 RepID=A0ABX7BQD6_9CAUL|nr:hypothetical protein [Brevundimonas vitisensis]QQQ19823.1 hypothetical protein JIP62_06985 [Brevundimonas vitisensis]
MIRLLDLPGAEQLHARLELCPHLDTSSDERTRQLTVSVLKSLGFGLDYWGAADIPQPTPEEEADDLTGASDEFDEYDAATLIEFWRLKGWDIRAPNGAVVSFYWSVVRAMIAVQVGQGPLDRMSIEAELFRQKKALAGETDPRLKKQNRAFLDFGPRERRRRVG